MAGYPVVFVDAGGLPVTYGSDGNGWPIEEALSGLPVTIVAAGGLPVVEGVGWPLPYGYGFMVDQNGGFLVDTTGARLIGSDPPMPTQIKVAAAARGLKFGIAYKPDHVSDTTDYRNLVLSEASLLVPEVAFQASTYQAVKGAFNWSRADAFVAIADAAGLPYRVPSGMIYPAHDMAWVSTNSGGTISPVLDGEGNPNLNASNVYDEIDALMEAFHAKGYTPTTINVSNELTDPTQTDGWRRHPWYTATSGPDWLIYAFQKARQLWPTTPLGLCQDLTEQSPDSYYTGLRSWFLTHLETLLTAGVDLSYVDLQGHMTFAKGYDPLSHRTFLQDVASLGVQIVVGEIDIRTGNTGYFIPGSYSDGSCAAKAGLMVSQYLDTILPFVNGGELGVWGLGDTFNAWGASERPLIYDASLAVKPAYYNAVLERLNFR